MYELITLLLQDKMVSTTAERYLLIYMIAVLLIVTTLIIVFFIVFQKRKNKLLLEKFQQQQAFEEAFAKTTEEVQEQTLKYIGQELHDNIGQLLSLASMQMGMLSTKISDHIKEPFTETQLIIKEGLGEIRALSKSLNSDVIQNKGFQASIAAEIDRLNRMKLIKSELSSTGDTGVCRNNKDSIILFRILQEFISNTVKHSKATNLKISLTYSKDNLRIEAKDDGIGFVKDDVKDRSGLLNMRNRAELTQSTFDLTSVPNQGVSLVINYPILKRAIAI